MGDILHIGFEVAAPIDRIPMASSLMQVLARSSPKLTVRTRRQAGPGKRLCPHSCAYFRDGTEAIACAGPERYRNWSMILGGMAYDFDGGWLSAGQIIAYKRAADGIPWRPWTREHQYTDVAPVLTGRLNWSHDQAVYSE